MNTYKVKYEEVPLRYFTKRQKVYGGHQLVLNSALLNTIVQHWDFGRIRARFESLHDYFIRERPFFIFV